MSIDVSIRWVTRTAQEYEHARREEAACIHRLKGAQTAVVAAAEAMNHAIIEFNDKVHKLAGIIGPNVVAAEPVDAPIRAIRLPHHAEQALAAGGVTLPSDGAVPANR